jgi:hypothetical protein
VRRKERRKEEGRRKYMRKLEKWLAGGARKAKEA